MKKEEMEMLMKALYSLNIQILKLEFKDYAILEDSVSPREVDITISLPKTLKINNLPDDNT